jgi:hypothetical protein
VGERRVEREAVRVGMSAFAEKRGCVEGDGGSDEEVIIGRRV